MLYVEDNPVNALLMEEVLATVPGLTLAQAASGSAALDSARSQAPDLLLLDMHLPDADGCELLARLRTLPGLERTPAVSVSADAMPEDIARARAGGFIGYWTKPLDIDQVRSDIVRLLDAG